MKQRRKKATETAGANRDAMLDAAEVVVIREGIGRLTLDAVAKQARLSKGGLLHHFPTKDALIDGLVQRLVGAWRGECEAAIDRQPAGPGRVPRAFLENCLSCAERWTETMRRRSFVLVAALAHDPRRVEPLRRLHRELSVRIEADGLLPGVGEAVQLAVDGLWYDWLFGLTELTPQKLAGVRAALGRLVEQSRLPARSKSGRRLRAAARKRGARAPGERGGGKRDRGVAGRRGVR
ncbi:MAG: TetR family transcriptional regulator [Phycisphaeraceae bacterium]|nr:TetR family transcriptional regulator [Phycisphaeraceae bacterium]